MSTPSYRPNWSFIATLGSCALVVWIAYLIPVDPRILSAALATVSFVLLSFQFAYRYHQTPAIARAAVLIILISLLLGAIGQTDLIGRAPLSVVAYPLIGQRWACLLLGVFYRHLLALGKVNPWYHTL